MARLLPLIVAAVVLYFWLKNRRDAAAAAAPEVTRSARSLELGFLPADRLDDEHAAPPVPELGRALAAVRNGGGWQPAADLLTAVGGDWERRTGYANSLASVSLKDDTWLLAWEKARPDDPDAALVRAVSTVNLAGEMRGAARASKTTAEQFDAFHRLLARSREELARAAELGPDDPTPYITEIWVALGLGYPHEEMNRLWAEITARAPHHYAAHYDALQYWCGKWRGSHELARDFAARAAEGAPLGTLMKAFPLVAFFEAHIGEQVKPSTYRGPELTALVDAALADAAAADGSHPRLPEMRHLLAYFLVKQGRYEAAVEQFRLVDGYVGALPWLYYGKRFYVAHREEAVRRAK